MAEKPDNNESNPFERAHSEPTREVSTLPHLLKKAGGQVPGASSLEEDTAPGEGDEPSDPEQSFALSETSDSSLNDQLFGDSEFSDAAEDVAGSREISLEDIGLAGREPSDPLLELEASEVGEAVADADGETSAADENLRETVAASAVSQADLRETVRAPAAQNLRETVKATDVATALEEKEAADEDARAKAAASSDTGTEIDPSPLDDFDLDLDDSIFDSLFDD